jgi:hypothetical protein
MKQTDCEKVVSVCSYVISSEELMYFDKIWHGEAEGATFKVVERAYL